MDFLNDLGFSLCAAPPVMNLFLRVGNKNNSCIRETQENSIEFLRQSSLPYIL